jgi:soluble lytic murein transglycosylase
MRRFAFPLVFLALLPPAMAQPQGNPMPAVRADQWAAAEATVADHPDPVARKLVAYFRVIAPNSGARAAEIESFATANPSWPNQDLLERRREDALATEADSAALESGCKLRPLTQMRAQLRCAEWARANFQTPLAASLAAAAWTGPAINDPGAEAGFLTAWGVLLTPQSQIARFDSLAIAAAAAPASSPTAIQAVTRQIPRLPPAARAIAAARAALIRNDPTALADAASLPAEAQADPALFLDRARALRRANRLLEAAALWLAQGDAAQTALAPRGADFWGERLLLARLLLRANDPDNAYALASPAQLPAPDIEAAFLAGFIALRQLGNPPEAAAHFRRLATLSPAAITQARAYYWLARAEQAADLDPAASNTKAAQFPTTFYGQLAARALGEDDAALARRIEAQRDPEWSLGEATALIDSEVFRAAYLLTFWAESGRARAFLLRADESAPDPATRAANAAFALGTGAPDTAVAIARRMGRDGVALPQTGWPAPFQPPDTPPVDPTISLGIIRQESSFDPGAASPVGARGLMQLMPATAQAVAKQVHETVTDAQLTDPALNMRLGTVYLKSMLESFSGCLPMAIAAYNAGPHRVQEWLTVNGDPRAAGDAALLDWLELIPFNETRNYVQRVFENIAIYRAKAGQAPPALACAAPA